MCKALSRAWAVLFGQHGQRLHYNMSKCEHGERITRFCMAEHCKNKQAAGCEYCIKKHHFHLTAAPLLTQNDLENIIKTLTLPTDGKFKSRTLQELACEYLRAVRVALEQWLQQAQIVIAEKLTFPLLRREGLLATYQRIRIKDYRRLNAQDLRAIHDFAIRTPPEILKRQQLNAYFSQVQQVETIVHATQGLAQALKSLPVFGVPETPVFFYPMNGKLGETFAQVMKEKSRFEVQVGREKEPVLGKTESSKIEELMKESSLLKHRISRELSQKEQREKESKKEEPKVEAKEDNKRISPVNDPSLGPSSNNGFAKELPISPNKDQDQQITKEPNKRNRRASIDEKLEMKFGLYQRDKDNKEVDARKKFLLDSIYPHGQEHMQVGDLENSLIPAPPPALLVNDTILRNKVIKIPISLPNPYHEHPDEIQSPIFKNKRKQGKSSGPLKELPLTEVAELPREDSERELGEATSVGGENQEDEPVELEQNEKNSLLLFSQALKSSCERAIVLLAAALKYAPHNLSAAEYLSYLYLENGQAKECLEVCENILLKIQDRAQEFEVTLHLHNNRAAALNMLGRYSESIVVLEKCLRFRRKHYFYKNLADAYFSLGIPQKAIMNYEKALRLDPAYDEAYYNLAVCQFLQSEYMSAQLNVEQALAVDPGNEAYLQLKAQLSARIANCVE